MLLHIIAFMHNDGVPEMMFQSAFEYAAKIRNARISKSRYAWFWPVRIEHSVRIPKYVQQNWLDNQDHRP